MIKYTTKLGDEICDLTASTSIGLSNICKQLAIPYTTVIRWVYDPAHEMYNKYILAKQMQLGHLADEIITIIDEAANDFIEVTRNGKKKLIQNREAMYRSRLRIYARTAIITKIAPVIYKTQPGKTKHTVTMTPPPDAYDPALKPALDKNPEADEKKKKTAKPSPLPKTTFATTDGLANEKPKTTFKYFDEGTYEEYNEKGDLICKTMPSYKPKPHHQGFW